MNQLNKKQKIVGGVILAIILGMIGWYIYGGEEQEAVQNEDSILIKENVIDEDEITEIEEEEKAEIVVHITGEVKKEGIVELKEGDRVADAIEASGGTTELADMSKINLAYALEDGMKIDIPSIHDKEEESENTEEYITEGDELSKQSTKKASKVNINTADQTELETLPGIGPSTALQIIQYRKENGKFNAIEDIKNVSGIGESKFNTIKEQISL